MASLRIARQDIDITLATESYNLAEGQSWDSFERAVRAVAKLVEQTPRSEGLLMNVAQDPRIEMLVGATQGLVRIVQCDDMNYDEIKDHAADEAAGRYLAYLDGDCVPADSYWLQRLIAPLRDEQSNATAGLTFYPGHSALTHACNVLDFGFLLDDPGGPVGCYASNNVAFLTQTRRKFRTPRTMMRCACYAHTQRLSEAGYEMLSVPEAKVVHEQPPTRRERFRRGYDLVATCWVHPGLPETPMLADRDPTTILTDNLMLDMARLDRYAAYCDLPPERRNLVATTIRRLRRLDVYGVRAAFQDGVRTGANEAALAAHKASLAR